jgi:hypothetical protein
MMQLCLDTIGALQPHDVMYFLSGKLTKFMEQNLTLMCLCRFFMTCLSLFLLFSPNIFTQTGPSRFHAVTFEVRLELTTMHAFDVDF